MCGRYVRRSPLQHVMDLFSAVPEDAGLDLFPRYNIAPTQDVAAIRQSRGGQRSVAQLRWGLVPAWADDPAIGNRMINARAETVAQKPAYRAAFRQRRCLIPFDGFYEWKLEDGRKQPYYIHALDDRLMAFAGLWERWDRGDEAVESCTILTTAPNELMRSIHNRMPVILPVEAHDIWLEAKTPVNDLEALLVPFSRNILAAQAVSSRVNNPRNDDIGCLQPLSDQ